MPDFFEGKFTDHYVDINGVRLHYTDWGGNSDKPLLLVHGLGVQLHTWDPVADQLKNDYRVYCLDIRGHGDSGAALDGYPLQAFVDDIYELAKRLNIIPFDFVGHSLGAIIAIDYAAQHGDTLKSVSLSDAGPAVTEDAKTGLPLFITKTSLKHYFDTEEEVAAFYAKRHPEWQQIFRDLHTRYQVRKNWVGKYALKADTEIMWIAQHTIVDEEERLWKQAAKINVPALVMWGETSFLIDKPIVDRMMAVIPKAKLAQFKSGHYIPREVPDEFLRELRAFLSS